MSLDWKIRAVKKSYSQNGEDLIVSYLLDMLKKREINYIDIGCNHPYRFNNTILLRETYKINKGILVEPNPELYKLLKRKRPKDTVINKAVGAKAGYLTYYMMNANTLNTFSKEQVQICVEQGYYVIRTMDIEILPINDLLKELFQGKLDFMSIDTEGYELEMIKSIDFSVIRPSIICMETLSFQEGEGKNQDIYDTIKFFKEHDYMVYGDTWINTIFVDRKAMVDGKQMKALL